MEYAEENMVAESSQADDALAPALEEVGETLPGIDEVEAQEQEGAGQAEAPSGSDKGGAQDSKSIKVRLQAFETRGYKRGKEEAARAWSEERRAYEAKIAKLAEYELREDAIKLAREEGVSEGIALRLLRAERGLAPASEPSQAEPSGQPRGDDGRFLPKSVPPTPEPTERTQELLRQAQLLETAIDGLNVSALLETASEQDKRALMTGDMDMAEFVRKAGGRRTPSPVRSANAADAANATSIARMSDKQFEALQARLDRGARFQL